MIVACRLVGGNLLAIISCATPLLAAFDSRHRNDHRKQNKQWDDQTQGTDKTLIESNRPISINPCLSKTLKIIISKRLWW